MKRLERPLHFSLHRSDGALLRTEVIDRELIKIGKLASCHLRIDDEKASRMHAVIELTGEATWLIDLGSAAGTIVNGKPVNKIALGPGDRIQIGETMIVLAPETPPAPPPPACPRCRHPLVPRLQAPVQVEVCQTCGGLWLDRATLRQALQIPGAAIAIQTIAADAARRAPLGGVDGLVSVRCPVCSVLMERRRHRRSGIVIDRCAEHGTWLDSGEPGRMLEGARSEGGPFRSSAAGEELTDPLPDQTPPIWIWENHGPHEPRPSVLRQILDFLLWLDSSP